MSTPATALLPRAGEGFGDGVDGDLPVAGQERDSADEPLLLGAQQALELRAALPPHVR